MKTLVGKIVSLAAIASTATLTASAAAPTLNNGVARDVTHLTLLTGPNLTSPARGVPAAAPAPTLLPPSSEPGTFRYVPQSPETGAVRKSGPGTLTLRKTHELVEPSTPASSTQKKPLPAPASLRFDSTLHPSPTQQATIERVPEPAPKRD